MSFRELLQDKIIKNRPNVHPQTIKSYVATLYNLPAKVNKKLNKEAVEKLKPTWYDNNMDDVKDYLMENVTDNRRRSILSAIFILTGDTETREQMMLDSQAVIDRYKEGEMSQKENENWINWPEVLSLYSEYKDDIDELIEDPLKKVFNNKEYNNIMAFVAFSSYVLQEPRRIMDYSEMKIRGFDTLTDNYVDMKKKVMVFNKYKTSNKYGRQEIQLSEPFEKLINFWLLLNTESPYLLNRNGKKLTQSDLTKLLNRIFDGRNISVDMLRHSYITHLYGDINLSEIEKRASNMGHSSQQAMMYIRRNDPKQVIPKKPKAIVITDDDE